uniref:AlNc14C33G2997 protein n=1 Tax=Albugo laibachii Nc14 TaxID=890382 RepID=F0W8A3_9STRA|nr:AlNc14C33G2997 [Albugo laibachii Nc14]|eukprot:CCA17303.1 AlNc14C33G2997 [Albugo laibachii Nc14]
MKYQYRVQGQIVAKVKRLNPHGKDCIDYLIIQIDQSAAYHIIRKLRVTKSYCSVICLVYLVHRLVRFNPQWTRAAPSHSIVPAPFTYSPFVRCP